MRSREQKTPTHLRRSAAGRRMTADDELEQLSGDELSSARFNVPHNTLYVIPGTGFLRVK